MVTRKESTLYILCIFAKKPPNLSNNNFILHNAYIYINLINVHIHVHVSVIESWSMILCHQLKMLWNWMVKITIQAKTASTLSKFSSPKSVLFRDFFNKVVIRTTCTKTRRKITLPGLAATISEIGYLMLQSRDMSVI